MSKLGNKKALTNFARALSLISFLSIQTAIETAAEKLKEAHKAQDLAAIDTAMTELNAAWTAASEDMYKNTQEGGAPGAEGQPGADAGQQTADANVGGDDVTDVPYEEVK